MYCLTSFKDLNAIHFGGNCKYRMDLIALTVVMLGAYGSTLDLSTLTAHSYKYSDGGKLVALPHLLTHSLGVSSSLESTSKSMSLSERPAKSSPSMRSSSVDDAGE